jgi:hypothetical protein
MGLAIMTSAIPGAFAEDGREDRNEHRREDEDADTYGQVITTVPFNPAYPK